MDLASASTQGLSEYLKKTGQSFNFAAVKATLLNTALNAGAMFIASLAIQAIVKGLDQYIRRAQRARKAAEQAQQAINESQSSLKKTTSTLSDTKDRFLELSEGVSRFSQNLSLSEKDYAEYLSIPPAKLYPSLIFNLS